MDNEQQITETTQDSSQASSVPAGTGAGKKRRAGTIIILLLVAGTVTGLSLWAKSKTHITTDNAFVEARIHSISTRIPGTVMQVLVKDNQFVNKGELLVELDS